MRNYYGPHTFANYQLVLRPGGVGEGVVRLDELSAAGGARITGDGIPRGRRKHTAEWRDAISLASRRQRGAGAVEHSSVGELTTWQRSLSQDGSEEARTVSTT